MKNAYVKPAMFVPERVAGIVPLLAAVGPPAIAGPVFACSVGMPPALGKALTKKLGDDYSRREYLPSLEEVEV